MSIELGAVTLDSGDWRKLSEFYIKLLDGKVAQEFGGHGVGISVPGTNVRLNFQEAEGYQPPVWPEAPGKQQQMEHLDLMADDMDAAVKKALSLGAKKAPEQFVPGITVMLDPAGHPFCVIPKS